MKKMLFSMVLTATLFLSFFSPVLCESAQELTLLFINVGKGDACLVQTEGRNYLIDVGSKDSVDKLLAALERFGVQRLDAIFLTHTHKDHTGGIKKLLKTGIPVEKLYYGALYTLEDKKEHPAISAAEKYGIELCSLEKGDSLFLSESVTLEVLAPFRTDETEDNNNSLVMRLSSPYGTILMTGDMELEEEEELAFSGTLSHCDILKVAHHGKNDSTQKSFVALTKPDYAVISTDTAEDDDTASPKVIARLMEVGSEVLKTQNALVGIRFLLSPDGIRYQME